MNNVLSKLKKHFFLKLSAVLIILWIILVSVDFIRFSCSENLISPIFEIDHNGCKCCEWRESIGIGYSFDYNFDSDADLEKRKYSSADFKIFGFTIYSKEN